MLTLGCSSVSSNELIQAANAVPKCEGILARALHKMGLISHNGMVQCRARVEKLVRKVRREPLPPYTEETFTDLCTRIML